MRSLLLTFWLVLLAGVPSPLVGADCNGNFLLDTCEVALGAPDCNGDGVPDECELDCDANGTPDECDISAGTFSDCDLDGVPERCL